MSVHYKFKSSLDYDTVTFDGLHISVADLKKAILQQKKIGKGFDFDLKITNAQTKEVYSDDDCLIPKNASVIVSRVPTSSSGKKGWDRNDSPSLLPAVANNDSDSVSFDKVTKSADLVSANASEDEKIRAMMSQSTQEYDPSRYVKTKTMVGPTPTNYTCYRCGRTGHWIKNCPTNAMDVKRSTGIPRSFMVTVDGPDVPGALLTSTGHYAVPMIDHEAYKEGKKEKPPFTKEASPVKEDQSQIPEELLCMICRDLLTDAVLIPCCGNSYCDECVRQALLDSDEHECPTCHEKGISPDTLIPVRLLRTAVMNFKNETGYIKSKKTVEIKVLGDNEPGCSSHLNETEFAEQASVPVEDDKENVTDVKESGKFEHPDTPVRDELADGSLAGESNSHTNSIDSSISHLKEEPEAFTIKTITTRQPGMGPPVPMMTGMKLNRMPPLRDGPYSHDPYMDPNMRHNHHGPPHRDMDPMRMGPGNPIPPPHMGGRVMHHMPYRPHMPQGPMHQMHPGYRPPPPMMRPPPLQRGLPMPPHMGNVPPPQPNHMMNSGHQNPQQFYPPMRHLPPPVPSSFTGPPPAALPHRRPLPPPVGPNPLASSNQPLPPGVRPAVPPPTTSHMMQQPPATYHHPGMPPPYPPRHDEYYQETRTYPERERTTQDPLDAFARELFEYRREDHSTRRRSASSSRSYSSRSGYRSRSGSRSRSRSPRSSRSKSRSYSSRSRSGSGSYSRSRSRSRSHHRSRTPASRSRSRSRSKTRTSKYSPPSKHRGNRSRSLSPRSRDRSPIPQPSKSQLPPSSLPPSANRRRRDRDYSPSTGYNVYHRDIPPGSSSGAPPSSHAGGVPPSIHPPPPPYDIHRGRFMDGYRYDNYGHHSAYEEDPRYMRDPRYDYLRYEEYYHQQGLPPPRPMRGAWPDQQTPPDSLRLRPNREPPPALRRPAPAPRRSRSRDSSVDRHAQQPPSSSADSSSRRRRSRSRSAPRGSRSERDSERDRERSKPKSRHDERDSKSSHSSSRRDVPSKDHSSSTRSSSVTKDGRSGHKFSDSSKNKDGDTKDSSHSKNADDYKSSHSEKHKDKKHKRSKGHHPATDTQQQSKKSKSGKKSSSEVDTEADSASGDVSRKGGGKKKKQKNKEGETMGKPRPAEKESGSAQEVTQVPNKGDVGEVVGDKSVIDPSPSHLVERSETVSLAVVTRPKEEFKDYASIWPEDVEDSSTVGEALNSESVNKDDLELSESHFVKSGGGDAGQSPQHEVAMDVDFATNQDDDENKTEADNEEVESAQLESMETSEAEQEDEEEIENDEGDQGGADDAIDDGGIENEDDEVDEGKSLSEAVGDSVLTAQVPELSKWERDDIDVSRQDDTTMAYDQQRVKPKVEAVKPTLPADIVQRAEKAILEKAPKAIVTVTTGETRKTEGNKLVEGGVKEKDLPSKSGVGDGVKLVTSSSTRSVEKSEMEKKDSDTSRGRPDRSRGRESMSRDGSSASNNKRSVSVERKRDKSRGSDVRRRERDSSNNRSLERDRGRRRSIDRGRSAERDRSANRIRRSKSPRRESRRSRSVEGRKETRRKSRSRSREERKRHGKRERSDSRSRNTSGGGGVGRSEKEKAEDQSKKSGDKEVLKSDKREHKNEDAEDKSRRRSHSPVSSKAKKGSDEKRRSKSKEKAVEKGGDSGVVKGETRERKPSTAASILDESKFEPDYDTPSDEEASRTAAGKPRPSLKAEDGSKSQQQRRSSSSSSSSGSGSSAESAGSSPAKKKRRKSSTDAPVSSTTTEKSNKNKNKKRKKHKKHKHKHKKSKKSHKSKGEVGNKESDSKKGKSKH